MTYRIEKSGKLFDVHFQTFDKSAGRKYVVDTHGKDRTAWPLRSAR
jgi:hypothetical protein